MYNRDAINRLVTYIQKLNGIGTRKNFLHWLRKNSI